MKSTGRRWLVAFTLFQLCGPRVFANDIEEIVVTADLRGRLLEKLPASATVFDAEDIRVLANQHFDELIADVPNMNGSGDGNRIRYLQLRGVGELEQYQGAPNPSIGFLIDDIDFSGIGTVATLFDIDRVEVLRGPQGTRYGANALGGLVYLRSTPPSAEQSGRLEFMAGSDGLRSAGVAFGDALTHDARATYRLSAQQYRSDGFRDNAYLARSDTNQRDETSLHARLNVAPNERWNIDIAALHIDVDDGYDAFAIDNSLTVLSDKPGRDAQVSTGASMRVGLAGPGDLSFMSLTSIAHSGIDFDFDADWGNAESWAPVRYDYVSQSHRDRRTLSQEFRVQSGDGDTRWLAGAYLLQLDEALESANAGDYYDPFYDFADSLDDRLESDYGATNKALFGQLEMDIAAETTFTAGLRVEHRRANYRDSTGLDENTSETMLGGEVSLGRRLGDDSRAYISLSRGYKAGGFNLGFVPPGRRSFGAEAMWNLEAGLRSLWLDGRLAAAVTVFGNRRVDQQVRSSYQADPSDPASFVFYTDNAARGRTTGLEAEFDWRPGDALAFSVRLGLLDAEFEDFRTPEIDLSGRDQAHAPGYTWSLGAEYRRPSGWYACLNFSGMDAFYFDVSNDQRSSPYALANARLGFDGLHWQVEAWARNMADRYYAVRGFYFGNEPPDFPPTLYTRAGDPRQLGVTITRRF